MADNYISVDIRGVEEVCARLKSLPVKIAQRAYARAMAASAVPIVESLEAHTPEADEGDRDENKPHLKDSIVTDITIAADGKGGRLQVGFGKEGYRARFLEFGHRIVTHKPALKEVGVVSPHPFMREAAAESAEQAIEDFAAALAQALDEEGI